MTNSLHSRPPRGWQVRPDLAVVCQSFAGERSWVIKDPIGLRYFRFREHEYAIIDLLDGTRTPQEIKAEFDATHTPRRITLSQLNHFLFDLSRNGLLLVNAADQGGRLVERHLGAERKQLAESIMNVLAIRLPGINPQGLLDRVYPWLRFIFAPWFLFLCAIYACLAIAIVIAQADVLYDKLPSYQAFVSPSNLVWLVIALASTKVIHEFGHALTCRHFGGECHELGVMFLVFTPCLYCNVTDSWMMPNKWHRVAVTAAGIVVELLLAATAAIIWSHARPGLLNSICLNVMIVCAVGTLFLNGNPLLRFDGYFILSDVLELPNLWQDAQAWMRGALSRCFFEPTQQPEIPTRPALVFYAVASKIYRVCITFVILVFLYQTLAAMRLQLLAYLIAGMIGLRLLWELAMNLYRFATRPPSTNRLHPRRTALTCLFIGGAIFFLLFIPLPKRLSATAYLEPEGAHRVYVGSSGTLDSAVAPYETVRAGQPIATLVDPDLDQQIEKLTGEHTVLLERVRNLEARSIVDANALSTLPTVREMALDVGQRLKKMQAESDALTIRSPVDGQVFPPAARHPAAQGQRLQGWSGTPLDKENRGCLLQRGTLLCQVGDPSRHQAVLYVRESDIELVERHQRVRIAFRFCPRKVLTGTVFEISDRPLEVVPPEIAATQEVPSQLDESNIARPLTTLYQVRVRIDQSDDALLYHSPGTAKIAAAPQTARWHLYRWLRRAFTIPASS